MAGEQAIERWRKKLRHVGGHMISVDSKELAEALAERNPGQFEPLRKILADAPPPRIQLPPAHLKMIVDYEPARKEPAEQPADVPRRGRKKLDAEADAGAD